MEVFKAVYRAIHGGKLLACHDLSEGGLAAALAEMCFGGGLGASIRITGEQKAEYFLFNETAGCFLAEIPHGANPETIFGDIPWAVIGRTVPEPLITAEQSGETLFTLNLEELKEAWQRPMKEVFRS